MIIMDDIPYGDRVSNPPPNKSALKTLLQ